MRLFLVKQRFKSGIQEIMSRAKKLKKVINKESVPTNQQTKDSTKQDDNNSRPHLDFGGLPDRDFKKNLGCG